MVGGFAVSASASASESPQEPLRRSGAIRQLRGGNRSQVNQFVALPCLAMRS
jgi:hypothetical protein